MTADQFDGLQDIIETMTSACRKKDDAAVIDSDFAFHQLLLTAAGLEDIVPIWKGLVARMRDFHIGRNRKHPDYGVIPFVHKRLLDVFRTGGVDAAVLALASHIENGEFNERAILERISSCSIVCRENGSLPSPGFAPLRRGG